MIEGARNFPPNLITPGKVPRVTRSTVQRLSGWSTCSLSSYICIGLASVHRIGDTVHNGTTVDHCHHDPRSKAAWKLQRLRCAQSLNLQLYSRRVHDGNQPRLQGEATAA
jgi:hypothetical protein